MSEHKLREERDRADQEVSMDGAGAWNAWVAHDKYDRAARSEDFQERLFGICELFFGGREERER